LALDGFAATVPVFSRYLGRLGAWVGAAEAHALARGIEPATLLDARLVPDMLPFESQVAMAANFTLRAAYPLAGLPVPAYGDWPSSFDGVRARLRHAAALLGVLEPAFFEAASTRLLQDRAGHATLSLEGPTFLFHYALPNFYFHLTMAYAILRSQGVALGKEDFDGFHRYGPPAS
jgi:hypothetical protein